MSETKKLPPVIYVAGPFRSPSKFVPGQQDSWGIMQNVMRAMDLSLQVWRLGAVAICPHANTAFFQNAAPDHVWLDGDLALLKRCDGCLLTPDFERSAGARAEARFAIDNGIPLFFRVDEVFRWMQDNGYPTLELVREL